jgi:hypothetical protein
LFCCGYLSVLDVRVTRLEVAARLQGEVRVTQLQVRITRFEVRVKCRLPVRISSGRTRLASLSGYVGVLVVNTHVAIIRRVHGILSGRASLATVRTIIRILVTLAANAFGEAKWDVTAVLTWQAASWDRQAAS